jgi:hypothetical protein
MEPTAKEVSISSSVSTNDSLFLRKRRKNEVVREKGVDRLSCCVDRIAVLAMLYVVDVCADIPRGIEGLLQIGRVPTFSKTTRGKRSHASKSLEASNGSVSGKQGLCSRSLSISRKKKHTGDFSGI